MCDAVSVILCYREVVRRREMKVCAAVIVMVCYCEGL